MNKKERINHLKAKKRVNDNINILKNSEKTLKSVYDVIFRNEEYTFLNVLNKYDYDEYTYKMVNEYNHSFCMYFYNNINLNEKYVGLLLSNSKEWIFSFFGLLISGFIPVLLSTTLKEDEIKYVVDKLEIKTIITDRKIDSVFAIDPLSIPLNMKMDNIDREFSNEIVFLTSGTTGIPKIVFYTGDEIVNQIFNAGNIFKNDKMIDKAYKGYFKHLFILPLSHIFGLFAVLIWFSFFNVTFILPLSLNPTHIKEASLMCHPTHIFAVPMFYEVINGEIIKAVKEKNKEKKFNKALRLSYNLQKTFGSFGLWIVRNILFKKYLNMILGDSIRYMITGGAFIDRDTLRNINLLGYPLINGYGSTEIGITSLSSSKLKERLDHSIGQPFKSVEYKIEDENLYVKASSMSHHYITSNGETKIIKDDEWINTLDKVIIKNSKYYLIGREDEIVILNNGENISLPLIEKEIHLPLAKEYVLIKDNEDKITLIASYDKIANIDKVIDELSHVDSKVISNIYYTNQELPKANSIKHKRKEILNLFNLNNELFTHLSELKENRVSIIKENDNELLNAIMSAFNNVFNKDINPLSHFYNDLGGDSLRYYILISEIEDKIHKELKIDYTKPIPYTPKEFMEYIESIESKCL